LTDIDIFDVKNIDIEKIKKDKTIYNLYNNSIKEPLHNFWFFVDNCKFLKYYENNNNAYSLVFMFNNKYEKHNKLLLYIKQIIEYIKIICSSEYNNIEFVLPWTHNDNFPVSIYFQYNKESLFLDHEKNDLDLKTFEFNNNNNFTLLFEIKYFTIKDNKIKIVLFAKLVQLEKQFDLKKSLICLSNPIKKSIENNISIIEVYKPINKIMKDDNFTPKPNVKISPDMLLASLNKLNKLSNKKENNEENKIISTETQYMEEKNQLKKTITNQDKDPYILMKNNYLEEKGINSEDMSSTETKIKKKKIIKIKKIKKDNT
jgi:hypothetical protein